MIVVYRGSKPFERFAEKTFWKDVPQHCPDHFRGNLADLDHFEQWSLGDSAAKANVFIKLPLSQLDLFCASMEGLKRIIDEHPSCSFMVNCNPLFEAIIPAKYRLRCDLRQSYTPSEERACRIKFDLSMSNQGIQNRVNNPVNRRVLSTEQAILQGANLWDMEEGLKTPIHYIELDNETTDEVVLINPWLDQKKLQKNISSLLTDFHDAIDFEVIEISDEINSDNIRSVMNAKAVISIERSELITLSAYFNKPSFTIIGNNGNPNDVQITRFENHFLAGADVLSAKGAEAVVEKIMQKLDLDPIKEDASSDGSFMPEPEPKKIVIKEEGSEEWETVDEVTVEEAIEQINKKITEMESNEVPE